MIRPSSMPVEPLARDGSSWAAPLALAGSAIGGVTLVGWLLGLPALYRPWAGETGMSPVTAATLCGAGLAVSLLADGRARTVPRLLARIGGLGVTLVGALRLARTLSLIEFDLDRAVGMAAVDPAASARVAPATGVGFLLLGSGVLLHGRGAPALRRAAAAAFAIVGLIALVALVGYSYGAAKVHGSMALSTALSLASLGAGSLALEPERGLWGAMRSPGPGGALTRLLVPALAGALFALGGFLLLGVRRGSFGVETGAALLVAACLALLVTAIAAVGRGLDRYEEIQRLAGERVRVSEAQFRAISETASDGIVVADAAGAVTYLNPAAERLFGRPAADAMGHPVSQFMPERYREAHRLGLARFVATGEGRLFGRTVELAGLRRDGEEFPLELSLATWRAGGEAVVAALLRDVTDRRRFEEDLRRYAADLESTNAELDAFSYSVSHDLRAPLRAIDGFSHALAEDFGDRLGETGADYLRRVRAAAQRMSQLIDDLLDLSRVSRAEIRRERVDLTAMARQVVEELRRREPGRAVDFDVAADLSVEADARLLRLALENLLGNAWKYTRTRPRARIELVATEHEGDSGFEVRDDGVGFDAASAHRLFGPFQRLHRADEFEGTGIGLATVQRIVRRHGGRVWATSVEGRGATFGFTL